MNYRYIILNAENEYYSSLNDAFFDKFRYNTWFICNFLSLQIRKQRIPADGPYNMFCCLITNEESSVNECCVSCLEVKLHVDEDELSNYMNMKDETERFEYYLSLLERAYRLAASTGRNIPIDVFMRLHQEIRENGYRNERLFKKKQLREQGIKIELHHVLTSYSYNLVLSIYDMHNQLISKGSIYETYPDDIFFNKTVRHLEFEDDKMIVTDFLDHPQFVCSLEDMKKGIIQSECVNENTRKYIPNADNQADFDKLKW